MSQFFGRKREHRKYPVISESPRMSEVVGNFTFREYCVIAGLPVVSAPFGWIYGPPFRRATMMMTIAGGTFAGFLLAYQNSGMRFMGYRPNANLCRKYGIKPADH